MDKTILMVYIHSANKKTSIQSNLAESRIAILSPITVANVFVHHVCKASTFISSGG